MKKYEIAYHNDAEAKCKHTSDIVRSVKTTAYDQTIIYKAIFTFYVYVKNNFPFSHCC